jgi:MFS transporter, DHA1 family, tetracycline resistance protein
LGEARALQTGLLFGAAGLLIYGLAPTGWLFLVGVPVMALWGFAGPALQGMMSARVGAGEQGQLQGANASVASVAALVGPGLFTLTFAFFIGTGKSDVGLASAGAPFVFPGAPFMVAAALLVAALVWSVRLAKVPRPAVS